MLRLSNLRAPLDFAPDQLPGLVAAALRLRPDQLAWARLSKKSVDARKKADVHFVLSVDFALKPGVPAPIHPNLSVPKETPYVYKARAPLAHRPLVVGFGPAGIMAGYVLARAGLNPVIIERGRDVDSRAKDVARFWSGGPLDPKSNVQFGEGGAGTFSDGKLTTGIKDPRCKEVLRVFFEHGAPEEILHQAKPHIGTDRLPAMVRAIREHIIQLGGEVRFEHKLASLVAEEGQLMGARIEAPGGDLYEYETQSVLLAVGHSARDTLRMLSALGVPMQKKPFSIGVRIEHPQPLIDRSQYGAFAGHPNLGAAEYKLSERLANGRGAYTFCMCPGGTVVAAASEPGALVVNGMSAFDRAGRNANSALLIGVTPDDFPGDQVLSGIEFQEKWERAAFALGGGDFHAPAQLAGDFLKGRVSKGPMDVMPSYRPGVRYTDLSGCLPDFATESMRQALTLFDRKLAGFAAPGAVLTGVETRSSCPVTLLRDENGMSALCGLYPAGEGAGHAGGIMSAAVDGMRCAEAIINSADY